MGFFIYSSSSSLPFVLSEQVGVRAGVRHQKHQFSVVLLPNHQPVGLDVALPAAGILAREQVGTVLGGERAGSGKQLDGVLDELHVVAALLATLHVFLEALRGYYLVLHTRSDA